MKLYTENFILSLIFFFLLILNYYQVNTQSFGFIIDQDWTIIYNSLLATSGFEQEYRDHPAYTTFLLYGICLKIINFFFLDLNLNILNILDDKNPEKNLQNIFICLRIINSIVIFLIYFLLFKTLKLFNISILCRVFTLLFFLFFESIYQLLFLLRSEALSVLLFLASNYFLLKYLKENLKKKYVVFSALFFTLSILTKTQIILLFLGSPFIFLFLKQRFIKKQNKIGITTKFYNKILYLFGFFVILATAYLYLKYPAPTDLFFFTTYFIIYLIFHNFFEKINYTKIKEIIDFVLLFVLGIFLTFVIVASLDLLNIIRFNYEIIPASFARPITHMSNFAGLYNISENNFLLMLNKIINHISNFSEIKYIFIKNKFIIFFIPIIYYCLIKKKFNKNLLYIFILFCNLIFITSIFTFFRDVSYYQIYLIPITLLIIIELVLLDNKKTLFVLCILFFAVINFQVTKGRIAEGFLGERTVIKLCGYSKENWNMINATVKNYEKFQTTICQ